MIPRLLAYNMRMRTAQILITCLVDTFFPEIGEAMVRILRRAGVDVDFPPNQTCCGQPPFNAGLRTEARKIAEHSVQAFETAAARTYELTEYIVDILQLTDLGARWEGPLAYHPTCHLHRGLAIDRQPRTLLSEIRGAVLRELPEAEDCCGFGGIFSVEHPELAEAMLIRKIHNLEESGSPTLVVCDAGCLMHIQGGLHRQKKPQKVTHIAEILDQSQRQPSNAD